MIRTDRRFAQLIAPEAVAKLRVRYTGTVTEATNGGGNKFQGLREFRIPALQLVLAAHDRQSS